jgi:hypothetical protein
MEHEEKDELARHFPISGKTGLFILYDKMNLLPFWARSPNIVCYVENNVT